MSKYIITGLRKGNYDTNNPISTSNLFEIGDTYITNTTTGSTGGGTTYYAGVGLNLDSATFSVKYGTTSGTAAQGDDSRINNGQTAYGWGNHASAGYLTSLPAHTHPEYEENLTFASTGSASVSRTGNTITVGATDTNTTYSAGTGLSLSSTTFSANFGTTSGTIAQGNDSRINNGQTAYGWGDHSSVGYLTSLPAHTHPYDNYGNWNLKTDGVQREGVGSNGTLDIRGGTNVTIGYTTGGIVTINSTGGGGTGGTTYTAGNGITIASDVISTNFGTTSTTVAVGNDSRINNGQTAYNWGNHASQGYLTSLPAHNHDGSYEYPLSFSSGGATTVSRTGNTITISSTDTNTTYSSMSLTELNTGTSTSSRVISAKTLTDWGVAKFAANSHTHSYESPLTFTGSGATSVSRTGNTITISSTDTNTNTTYSAGTGLSLTSTTFSVNYGTTTGTAAQGNDSRINNGQTAYGWGNHASVGYLTSLPAHTHPYDNYNGWDLLVDGAGTDRITSGEDVNFIGGSNVTLSRTGNNITINSSYTNTNTTYTAGGGLSLSGTVFSHTDTSSQGSVNNSGSTVIQDIYLDGYGHVTSINSYNLNNVFVPKSGGEFTGAIIATMFTQSLRKYKENIQPYKGNALQIIKDTDIVTYDRKDKAAVNQIGIIADDSAKEYLNEERNAVDIYKTLFLQNKAIQELNELVESQQSQIDELKELVNKLLDK